MNAPVKILFVNLGEPTVQRALQELGRSGFPLPVHVITSTATELAAALAQAEWDLILSDNHPGCEPLLQLRQMLKERDLTLPIVIFSSRSGEELVADSLLQGASDYVLQQRPARLGAAVARLVGHSKPNLPALSGRSDSQSLADYQRAQQQLNKVNRTLAVLKECNQVLVRATEERQLLQEICRVIVELGGYRLCWVGFPEQDADQSIVPVAQAGFDEGYVAALNLSWGENERSRGPAGCAIRSGKATVVRNIQTDPGFSRWREKALLHGFSSAMALPLLSQEQLVGVLALYSSDDNAFNAEELDLLVELADDLTYGMVSLRTRDARRQAEEALRSSELRFQSVWENSVDGMKVTDACGIIVAVNESFCALVEIPRDRLLGQPFHVTYGGRRDPGLLLRQFRERFLNRTIERRQERRIQLPNGNRRDLEVTNSFIDQAPRQVVLLSLFRDISARKKAEAEAAKLSAFARFNPNPVMEFSRDGTLNYANEAALEMMRALGKLSLEEILPPNYLEMLRETLASGRSRLRQEISLSQRIISWSFFPIRANEVVHAYAGDVTERQALEEQLRQAQKMESIGQLAGGIAHDFNNILTVIHGHASLWHNSPLLSRDMAESASQIALAAERASNLTRQLLTFSRKHVIQRLALDLNESVLTMSRMLRRIVGEDISLTVFYGPNLPMVQADTGMVEQVIMNLVVNARDAMPKGGQISLSTTKLMVDAARAALYPEAQPGPCVCLTVRDEGGGIRAEHLPRIFEPFFTTKDIGQGTGLGLATVYGIVKQHQGWIEVESLPDRGSTFRVFFPAQEEDASLAREPQPTLQFQPARPLAPGRKETILVVEDEPALRTLVVHVLRRQGYTVLEAANGPAALLLWQVHRQEIDLLLTDMVMPDGMNGRELAEKVHQDKPLLKVIITSGYSAEASQKGLQLSTDALFLPKPYPPHQLTQVVRQCLDQVPARIA